jgi:hypothetical protein
MKKVVSRHTPPHNQNYKSSNTSPAQSQDTNKDFPVHILTQPSGEAANCLSELVSDVLSGLSEDTHF